MKGLSGGVLLLAFIGVLAVLFGTYAAYWYLAHQMAWWTFAVLGVGSVVFIEFIKQLYKEVTK